MSAPRPPVPRGPLILLALMTLVTFLGPLVIWLTLRGGRHRDFPPDRPIEWIALVGIIAAATILMIACLAVGVANHRAYLRARAEKDARDKP